MLTLSLVVLFSFSNCSKDEDEKIDTGAITVKVTYNGNVQPATSVKLYKSDDADNAVKSDLTDANGKVVFNDVKAGKYIARVHQPIGNDVLEGESDIINLEGGGSANAVITLILNH